MSEKARGRVSEKAERRVSEEASERGGGMATSGSLSISVIIPNWNGAPHLPACLASLYAQNYAGCEIIVVDNASEDDSLEVLAHYPE
ncbi:MAG: glycosyltransferase, partial [Anaerolineae bacterium]|nr:glycosyltransferase [Anaerolineae bacterium]